METMHTPKLEGLLGRLLEQYGTEYEVALVASGMSALP